MSKTVQEMEKEALQQGLRDSEFSDLKDKIKYLVEKALTIPQCQNPKDFFGPPIAAQKPRACVQGAVRARSGGNQGSVPGPRRVGGPSHGREAALLELFKIMFQENNALLAYQTEIKEGKHLESQLLVGIPNEDVPKRWQYHGRRDTLAWQLVPEEWKYAVTRVFTQWYEARRRGQYKPIHSRTSWSF